MKSREPSHAAVNWVAKRFWQSTCTTSLLLIGIFVQYTMADDDAFVVTPAGFSKPGIAITLSSGVIGHLQLTIRDHVTGQLTACRVNVIGPDGNFYQPATNRLSAFSLA